MRDGQLAREELHTNGFEDPDCIWKEGQSLHRKSGLSMIKMGAESLENGMIIAQKIKNIIPYDPAILLFILYTK